MSKIRTQAMLKMLDASVFVYICSSLCSAAERNRYQALELELSRPEETSLEWKLSNHSLPLNSVNAYFMERNRNLIWVLTVTPVSATLFSFSLSVK